MYSNKLPPASAWYRTGEARIAPWYFGIMRAEVQMRRDHYTIDGLVSGFNTKWVSTGRLPTNLANESYYSMLAAEETNLYLYFWKSLVKVLPRFKPDPAPDAPANREARYRQYMRERDEKQKAEDQRILNGDYD